MVTSMCGVVAFVQGPLRDVRRALLEADVSLPVVRRFIKKVEERAMGLEVRGKLEQRCWHNCLKAASSIATLLTS